MRALTITVRAGSLLLALVVAAPASAAPVQQAKAKRLAQQLKRAPAIAIDQTAMKIRSDATRQLYLLGKQQLRFAAPAAALKAFRTVYRRERVADVLFDMAVCEARLGRMRRASALNRRYVRTFKRPMDRVVAIARFVQLVQRVSAKKRAKN